MRLALVLAAAGAAAFGVLAMPTDAQACGGCFHAPSQNGDVITDHRMVFRVTPQATTLYDEIEYQGNPADFAWVLPIHGTVTVGLSSDVVFAALDQATATTIVAPNLPPCATCGCFNGTAGGGSGSSSGGSSGGFAADAGSVNVLGQQTVGPYDTVQLQSTSPNALENWLAANNYSVPAAVQPIIAAYVNEGFDFLALRLQPGQSVSAMRPVRVTSTGAGLQLPLRMVAAGTGPTVGISLWVVGDGRYEPQNFKSFELAGTDLTWDFSTNLSNYATIRAQKEAALNNAGWQIESAMQLSPYQITSPIQSGPADMDYLPIPASDGGGAGETADQVRTDDLNTLFPSTTATSVWITRLRADLSHAALATDLTLQASASQTEMSNFYQVTQYVNAPTCPAVPNPCPPCDTGGSSGGIGGGSSGGSGGVADTSAASSKTAAGSGCSTTVGERDSDNFGIILAGLVMAAIATNRIGRKRDEGEPGA